MERLSGLSCLTFTILLANSANHKLMMFYFLQKTGFDIQCKLSPHEMSKPFFSEKKKNNKNNFMPSAEIITQHTEC